jgi:putative membrane protein (TIGR04086 family)
MSRQPGYHETPLPISGGGKFAVLLKGIIMALLISVVLLFIGALVLYFTAVPEKAAPYLVFGISLAAIIIGSSFAGKRIGSKGWLYGGIVGFAYVGLMLVFGLIVLADVAMGLNFITKLFLGFVFGAAGGMWGVNR